MNDFVETIREPWPWYVAGPLIGLTVPLLLILGNKIFGISSSLRHICAACIPAKIPFFNYNWKKEAWNLFFVAGILCGAYVATFFLSNGQPVIINENLREELRGYGIKDLSTLVPLDLFSFNAILSVKGFLLIIVGGFLVGFGTRYAGGCTSGHAITGISMLQLPSIIATACFMIGGIIMANFILPYILML